MGAPRLPSLPRAASPWAMGACALVLLLDFGLRGGLPFVRFPAFAFPDTGGVMAVPLFLADGAPADPQDFVDFAGVGPDAVDEAHGGLPSVVDHRFAEAHAWLAAHPGAGGDVAITVGMRVLRADAAGAVHIEDRVAGQGTARRRSR